MRRTPIRLIRILIDTAPDGIDQSQIGVQRLPRMPNSGGVALIDPGVTQFQRGRIDEFVDTAPTPVLLIVGLLVGSDQGAAGAAVKMGAASLGHGKRRADRGA